MGNSYSNASKRAEIAVRYVEIATNILKNDPAENTGAIRGWAIEVISHYSEVPLPATAMEELEQQKLLRATDEVRRILEESEQKTKNYRMGFGVDQRIVQAGIGDAFMGV